jgi:hypothetical protein
MDLKTQTNRKLQSAICAVLRSERKRLMPSTLRLEITDAAGRLADSGFERFHRRGRFGARLGEIVVIEPGDRRSLLNPTAPSDTLRLAHQ